MSLGQAIDGLVEACRREVPDCVYVGVVDLSTGMPLRSVVLGDLPQDLVELFGALMVEHLQSRAVRGLERFAQRRDRGGEPEPYVREVLVHGPDHVHLFLRSRRHPDLALGVACSGAVKVGLLFSQARRALRDFDDAGALDRSPV